MRGTHARRRARRTNGGSRAVTHSDVSRAPERKDGVTGREGSRAAPRVAFLRQAASGRTEGRLKGPGVVPSRALIPGSGSCRASPAARECPRSPGHAKARGRAAPCLQPRAESGGRPLSVRPISSKKLPHRHQSKVHVSKTRMMSQWKSPRCRRPGESHPSVLRAVPAASLQQGALAVATAPPGAERRRRRRRRRRRCRRCRRRAPGRLAPPSAALRSRGPEQQVGPRGGTGRSRSAGPRGGGGGARPWGLPLLSRPVTARRERSRPSLRRGRPSSAAPGPRRAPRHRRVPGPAPPGGAARPGPPLPRWAAPVGSAVGDGGAAARREQRRRREPQRAPAPAGDAAGGRSSCQRCGLGAAERVFPPADGV